MNTLYTAIYNHFKTLPYGDFYNNLSGRLFLNHAPQNTAFPFCVYFIVTNYNDLDFAEEREEFSVQFNIFSENNSAIEAGSLLENLKAMYDNCELSVSGWRFLKLQRNFVMPNNDFGKVPPVHGYSIEYDALIERTRG